MPAQTPTPITAKISTNSNFDSFVIANGNVSIVQKTANQKTIPSGEELSFNPLTARYAKAERIPDNSAIEAPVSIVFNDGETIKITPTKEKKIHP